MFSCCEGATLNLDSQDKVNYKAHTLNKNMVLKQWKVKEKDKCKTQAMAITFLRNITEKINIIRNKGIRVKLGTVDESEMKISMAST